MGSPDVAEFLQRVVSWPKADEPGYINMHYVSVRKPGTLPGRPARTLHDFEGAVAWAKRSPSYCSDIYICLSRQRELGLVTNERVYAKRGKNTAMYMRSIYADVDVKEKGYKDVTEALVAVKAFCDAAKIPCPSAFVGSGGGLHIYWISNRNLSLEEWEPYAQGLVEQAKVLGLRIDASVTTDCARVLRVPDTYNFKETVPREVKLLGLAPQDIDFENELGHIKVATPVRSVAGSTANLTPGLKSTPKPDPFLDSTEYQKEIGEIPTYLLNSTPILAGCPLLRAALETGGRYHDQPIWMLMGLAATFMEDGRTVFHDLSRDHADYSEANTDAMYERKEAEREEKGLGYPSCKSFEGYGGKECPTCPYRGKIRSPLNITATTTAQVTAEIAAVPATPTGPAKTLMERQEELRLPPTYFLTAEGQIATSFIKNKGTIPITAVLIFDVLSDVWLQMGSKLNFTTTTSQGVTAQVTYAVRDSTTALATLSKQEVNFNPAYKDKVSEFMATWMAEWRKQVAREAVAYGWHSENDKLIGWAYGGIIYKGEKQMPAAPGDKNVRRLYTPCGSIDTWFKALKLVTEQHRPAIEIITAAAFASPLMKFTGHYAGALVAYSQSGGNKSTALNVGAAVWGNPKLTKEVAATSSNSLRGKMSELSNLPFYWDDVSSPQAVERAATLISDITQGKDGGKMNQDRSQKEVGEWQSLLMICSNRSMFDYLIAHNKSDAASIYRTFEFVVPPKGPLGRIDEHDATLLQQQLEVNFGRIGEMYSAGFLAQPNVMQEFVSAIHKQISKEVNARESERFWTAIAATIIAGSRLANKLGAGFNIEEIHQCLVESYQTMRTRVEESDIIGTKTESADSALTAFFKAYGEYTLRTYDRVAGKGGRTMRLRAISWPDKNKKVSIHWVIDDRLLRISRAEFTEYLEQHGFSPSMVIAGLKNAYEVENERSSLAAGTEHPGGQESIIVIKVPRGSWLDEQMNAYDIKTPLSKPSDRLTLVSADAPK